MGEDVDKKAKEGVENEEEEVENEEEEEEEEEVEEVEVHVLNGDLTLSQMQRCKVHFPTL